MTQKIKSALISIFIIVILFGGLIWFSRRDNPSADSGQVGQSQDSGQGILSAEETIYDFGNISMADGKVIHSYKIKNNSDNPATISKLYTSCMCTEATLVMPDRRVGPYGMQGHGFIPKINQKINPGEETTIEVVFDPAAHGPAGIGRVDRVVFVESEAGLPLQLRFTATVTP